MLPDLHQRKDPRDHQGQPPQIAYVRRHHLRCWPPLISSIAVLDAEEENEEVETSNEALAEETSEVVETAEIVENEELAKTEIEPLQE